VYARKLPRIFGVDRLEDVRGGELGEHEPGREAAGCEREYQRATTNERKIPRRGGAGKLKVADPSSLESAIRLLSH
jgi:hypothetical protein